MSLDDPYRGGAPTPLGRTQQPADPASVENPATAAQHAPERVVPAGFSRGEDAIYQAQWGTQQAWAPPAAAQAPQLWQQPVAVAPSRARVPAAMPLDGQVYAQALRPLTRRVGRWFLAFAICIGIASAGTVVGMAIMLPAMFGDLSGMSATIDTTDPTALMELMDSPAIFLANNLMLASWIPASVVALAAYGDRVMGFAASVVGRWRWGITGRSALVIVPIFVLYIGSMLAIDSSVTWEWNPSWLLVIVVLLTTPLQATGEEFLFRGFLTQQLGSWIKHPVVASLVPGAVVAIAFGLVHIPNGYGPLAILQVTLVGFTCTLLTWRTGGLEAASVLHTANNLFIMLPLALMGVSPFATSTGASAAWWTELVSFGAVVVALGLSYLAVHLISKRWQRTTVGAPGAEALLLPRQQTVAIGYGAMPQAYAAAPGYGAPGYGAPGYGAPGYGAPQQAPGYGAPGYGMPPHEAPGYGAPGYGMPQQPGYGAPGYGMPQQPWAPPQQPAAPWERGEASPPPLSDHTWGPAPTAPAEPAPTGWGAPAEPAPATDAEPTPPAEPQHPTHSPAPEPRDDDR